MGDAKRRATLARLQSILDSSVAAGVPGISASIYSSPGDQHQLFAGYKDIKSESAIDQATTFGIGSVTKVFVAVVVLQLVEEKKLKLEDTAISIIGPIYNLDKIQNATTATIAELLSHTSGIPSWEDDPDWIADGRGENIDLHKDWEKGETLHYVSFKPPGHESEGLKKGKYHYANTNYTILGLIIEHVAQNTAESEIRRRILEPLGMESTYFEGWEQPVTDQTPRRYHWATDTFHEAAGVSPYFSEMRPGLIDVTGSNLSVSWVAGGMISNPTELVKFAVALRSGKLLTSASMTTLMDWTAADAEKDMGKGVFRLRQGGGGKRTWVGHNGGVLGFTAALWWDVESDCIVSILSNVGASHAGVVPSSAGIVAWKTDFLKIASELSKPSD